ncbi:MAG: integrase family protein [Gemmatimonadetes bacterium]|nr:integrase family protein [Gemmatimonadota bacterium]
MYKNTATGFYEHDFRQEKIAPRFHISYGTGRKDDATRLHATMLALFKAKDVATIEAIRQGAMSVQQVARLVADGKPLSTVASAGAWPSVRASVLSYLDWLTANPKKSDGTRAAAETQTNRFLEWLGDDADLPLDMITTKRVTDYQAFLIRDGYETNTVTAYVWRVGTVFRFHRDTELRDAQESKRPPMPLHVPIDPHVIATTRTRRERSLSEAEGERLLAACPPRLLCPVALGLFAGLRVDEMLHLRPGFDVDLALGLITIQIQPGWRPKTGKRRHIPIAPPLRPLIEYHLATFANDEWLTPSIRTPDLPFNGDTFGAHFLQIVADAELITGRTDPKGVVYHTLRHTFASWLIARGCDLYTVAQLLGNSLKMVETTYGHLSPDFKADAVKRLVGAVAVPDVSAFSTTTTANARAVETNATENATLEAK